MSNKLRIYGCGGCGIGLAKHYLSLGYAEIVPALIDTSVSNLRNSVIDPTSTYLLEGLDGSGKIRSENYDEINKSIKQILVQLVPGDFNIVAFSTSGGSGSVIGPLLIAELNKRRIPVIAIVVGSDESVIAAENTLKTLQSLESVAQATETPVIMSFHKNNPHGKQSDTNADVWNIIGCLSVLFSGENDRLDRADLVHWLHYNKVYDTRSQLSTLHIASDKENFKRITAPLSVASLYVNPDHPHVTTSADYHTEGYADFSTLDLEELHFAIGINDLAKIGNDIKSQVNKLKEERAARVQPDSILDGVGGSDGMLVL